jgi:hypothetical protein
LVQSSYFSGESYTAISDPAAVLARERLLSPTHHSGTAILMNDDENMARETKLKGKQKAKGTASTPSSEFGDEGMSMDAEFMEQLDQVVMKAMLNVQVPPASPISGSRAEMRSRDGDRSIEVIFIEDDEDDKENIPMPTRRVQRRMGPIVPEGDVIELFDSD